MIKQHVDTSRPPVVMVISSSELRVTGFCFKVKEVIPAILEGGDVRGGLHTRGEGL